MVRSMSHHHIEALHRLYCSETGHRIPYVEHRHGMQWSWLVVALDNMTDPQGNPVEHEKAVILVARRIKRLAQQFAPWRNKLMFSKFVDSEFFTEHLAAEFAERRKPKVATGYKEVCQATGRDPKPPTPEPKHVETIMQEHQKMAEMLKQWKSENL